MDTDLDSGMADFFNFDQAIAMNGDVGLGMTLPDVPDLSGLDGDEQW
jgi:hypothetical protein